MNSKDSELIIAIIQLFLTYGVKAVTDAIAAFKLVEEEITIEKIEALKALIKKPEEY